MRRNTYYRRYIFCLSLLVLFSWWSWWRVFFVPQLAITRVQQRGQHSAAGVASFASTFAGAPTAGNCLIFGIFWESATVTLNSLPSGAATVGTTKTGSGMSLTIAYIKNCTTTNSFTWGFSAVTTIVVENIEVSGLDTVAPLDQIASTAGVASNSGLTGTTPGTSTANEYWYGCIGNDGGLSLTSTPNNGFTLLNNSLDVSTGFTLSSVDKIVSATGTASSGGSFVSGSADYIGYIATFQPAGDGGITAFFPQVMGTFEYPTASYNLRQEQYKACRAPAVFEPGPGFFTDDPFKSLANPIEWQNLPVEFPFASFNQRLMQLGAAKAPSLFRPDGEAAAVAGDKSAVLSSIEVGVPTQVYYRVRPRELIVQPVFQPQLWVVSGELQIPWMHRPRQQYVPRYENAELTMDASVWSVVTVQPEYFTGLQEPYPRSKASNLERDTFQLSLPWQFGGVTEIIHSYEPPQATIVPTVWRKPMREEVHWRPLLDVDVTTDKLLAWAGQIYQAASRQAYRREAPEPFDTSVLAPAQIPLHGPFVFDSVPIRQTVRIAEAPTGEKLPFLIPGDPAEGFEAFMSWAGQSHPRANPTRRLYQHPGDPVIQLVVEAVDRYPSWFLVPLGPLPRTLQRPQPFGDPPGLDNIINVTLWEPLRTQDQIARRLPVNRPGPPIQAEVFPTAATTETNTGAWNVPQTLRGPAIIRPPFFIEARPLIQEAIEAGYQAWNVQAQMPAFRRSLSVPQMHESYSAPPIQESGVIIIVAGPYKVPAGQIFVAGAVAGDIVAE